MNKFKYNRNATKDKTILVTGGTGSFGRNFIKKLLIDDDIKKVIVYSRDEQKQYKMSQIYKETDFPKADEEMFKSGFANLPALEGLKIEYCLLPFYFHLFFTQCFRRCAKDAETQVCS